MSSKPQPVYDASTIRQLFDKESCTYTYMIGDSVSKECVLIDPVDIQAERDIKAVAEAGFTLKFVINTHVHADHITGSGIIKQKVQGVRSIISKASGAKADICVEHGDEIKFGATVLKVRATPGHTPGCVTYVLAQRFAFVGDSLLIRGCGRTDFQGGDPGQLYDSNQGQILSLPPTCVLYPGHDYTGRTMTTVAEEKKFNPRLTKTREEFIAFMKKRFDGSNYPKKLDASLPANMVCGIPSAPEGKLADTKA